MFLHQGTQADMTRDRRVMNSSEKKLQFELLLASISADFINLPADQIDSKIEDTQRQVCECLDLDLCVLWQQPAPDQDDVMLTNLYYRETIVNPFQPSDPTTASEKFPWFFSQIQAGNIVNLATLADLPVEATIDLESCMEYDIKSNLSLPLTVGGKTLIGVLCFNTMHKVHTWPEEVVIQTTTGGTDIYQCHPAQTHGGSTPGSPAGN